MKILKSGPFSVRLSAENKTTRCNSRAFFPKGKRADKNQRKSRTFYRST